GHARDVDRDRCVPVALGEDDHALAATDVGVVLGDAVVLPAVRLDRRLVGAGAADGQALRDLERVATDRARALDVRAGADDGRVAVVRGVARVADARVVRVRALLAVVVDSDRRAGRGR